MHIKLHLSPPTHPANEISSQSKTMLTTLSDRRQKGPFSGGVSFFLGAKTGSNDIRKKGKWRDEKWRTVQF
jgi:hypothetical protein